MKSGQRHDLQQNRQNISIGEVLIHKEGGRTYEELETTDSIGVKRNDAWQGAVPQHQKQIRKAGKIRQQKIPEDQEKNHWKVHMYLCSNLQEIHLEI